jgi:hypothetical protein
MSQPSTPATTRRFALSRVAIAAIVASTALPIIGIVVAVVVNVMALTQAYGWVGAVPDCRF